MVENLALPKWTFTSERKLKQPLQRLGLSLAFDRSAADLSGIDGMRNNLYIEEAYHKTFVAVDEEGTEAAAATVAVLSGRGVPPARVNLTFDRPFLFVVYDDTTRQLLFLGHLADPG